MSIFTKVKMPSVGSSKFNLNHDVKLSFDMGELIPTCVLDVLPGDKFRINTETMLRFLPLVSPVMHKYKVKTEFFFVPNRITWPNWEKWITGELEVAPPHVVGGQQNVAGTIADYLGFPVGHGNNQNLEMNAFPIAAYHKIWDEYYRDENLQPETFTDLVSGQNAPYQVQMRADPLKRAWMHDYFTSCLPFAQKSDAVSIPLGEIELTNEGAANGMIIKRAVDHSNSWSTDALKGQASPNDGKLVNADGQDELVLDPNGALTIQSTTIESLRTAFKLQEWMEKNARGGTRYIEHIKAHFGVFSSDKRMQRPEYLGGSSQNVIISEVLATAETEGTADIPLGEMAGHGISVGKGNTFTYRAEEHGFIIGIMSVCPVTSYFQGLPKMFNRPSYLDYYWPSFANLGEQEVLNSEVYVGDQTLTVEELFGTFGYIPRNAEYKYLNSRIAGDMKTTLLFWNHARNFSTAPSLNAAFIECAPDKRIFAVTDTDIDSIVGHVFNNVSAVRKIPKYALPTL